MFGNQHQQRPQLSSCRFSSVYANLSVLRVPYVAASFVEDPGYGAPSQPLFALDNISNDIHFAADAASDGDTKVAADFDSEKDLSDQPAESHKEEEDERKVSAAAAKVESTLIDEEGPNGVEDADQPHARSGNIVEENLSGKAAARAVEKKQTAKEFEDAEALHHNEAYSGQREDQFLLSSDDSAPQEESASEATLDGQGDSANDAAVADDITRSRSRAPEGERLSNDGDNKVFVGPNTADTAAYTEHPKESVDGAAEAQESSLNEEEIEGGPDRAAADADTAHPGTSSATSQQNRSVAALAEEAAAAATAHAAAADAAAAVAQAAAVAAAAHATASPDKQKSGGGSSQRQPLEEFAFPDSAKEEGLATTHVQKNQEDGERDAAADERRAVLAAAAAPLPQQQPHDGEESQKFKVAFEDNTEQADAEAVHLAAERKEATGKPAEGQKQHQEGTNSAAASLQQPASRADYEDAEPDMQAHTETETRQHNSPLHRRFSGEQMQPQEQVAAAEEIKQQRSASADTEGGEKWQQRRPHYNASERYHSPHEAENLHVGVAEEPKTEETPEADFFPHSSEREASSDAATVAAAHQNLQQQKLRQQLYAETAEDVTGQQPQISPTENNDLALGEEHLLFATQPEKCVGTEHLQATLQQHCASWCTKEALKQWDGSLPLWAALHLEPVPSFFGSVKTGIKVLLYKHWDSVDQLRVRMHHAALALAAAAGHKNNEIRQTHPEVWLFLVYVISVLLLCRLLTGRFLVIYPAAPLHLLRAVCCCRRKSLQQQPCDALAAAVVEQLLQQKNFKWLFTQTRKTTFLCEKVRARLAEEQRVLKHETSVNASATAPVMLPLKPEREQHERQLQQLTQLLQQTLLQTQQQQHQQDINGLGRVAIENLHRRLQELENRIDSHALSHQKRIEESVLGYSKLFELNSLQQAEFCMLMLRLLGQILKRVDPLDTIADSAEEEVNSDLELIRSTAKKIEEYNYRVLFPFASNGQQVDSKKAENATASAAAPPNSSDNAQQLQQTGSGALLQPLQQRASMDQQLEHFVEGVVSATGGGEAGAAFNGHSKTLRSGSSSFEALDAQLRPAGQTEKKRSVIPPDFFDSTQLQCASHPHPHISLNEEGPFDNAVDHEQQQQLQMEKTPLSAHIQTPGGHARMSAPQSIIKKDPFGIVASSSPLPTTTTFEGNNNVTERMNSNLLFAETRRSSSANSAVTRPNSSTNTPQGGAGVAVNPSAHHPLSGVSAGAVTGSDFFSGPTASTASAAASFLNNEVEPGVAGAAVGAAGNDFLMQWRLPSSSETLDVETAANYDQQHQQQPFGGVVAGNMMCETQSADEQIPHPPTPASDTALSGGMLPPFVKSVAPPASGATATAALNDVSVKGAAAAPLAAADPSGLSALNETATFPRMSVGYGQGDPPPPVEHQTAAVSLLPGGLNSNSGSSSEVPAEEKTDNSFSLQPLSMQRGAPPSFSPPSATIAGNAAAPALTRPIGPPPPAASPAGVIRGPIGRARARREPPKIQAATNPFGFAMPPAPAAAPAVNNMDAA